MNRIETDLCVVGAGSGGLSVAAGAAQMGARVVLIERGEMGGDCLNYGCVPSKALLAAGAQAHAMGAGAAFGVAPVAASVDYAAAMDHVHSAIAAIAPNDSQERYEKMGVTVLRAHARFTSPRDLQAGDRTIRARRFVIATGSSPLVPPIPGLADVPYETNETIFARRSLPAHLLIVGGGPIGLEMAQAHRRLGSAVTVIEAATALGTEDPEMAGLVLDRLRGEGVGIVERSPAVAVRGAAGSIEVEVEGGQVHRGSHLLVAVGRSPDTADLGLDAAGVATERGAVKTGRDLTTSNRRILAVGDVAGRQQFTHVAGYHAGIVVRRVALGLPAKLRDDHLPHVTYTDPELAQVGLTEAAARARHGARLQVVRSDYAGNDRAIATAHTTGRIKVMVVRGRPVGVTIAGAEAGELIAPWALMLSARLGMSAMAGMVAPYPTLGEISKGAAGLYFSPRLFDNPWLRRGVRAVQRLLP